MIVTSHIPHGIRTYSQLMNERRKRNSDFVESELQWKVIDQELHIALPQVFKKSTFRICVFTQLNLMIGQMTTPNLKVVQPFYLVDISRGSGNVVAT